MSKLIGLDRQVGLPLAAAILLASGLGVAYFMWLGTDSTAVAKLALLSVMVLSWIVSFLAAGVMTIAHSLHTRIERLEQQGKDSAADL